MPFCLNQVNEKHNYKYHSPAKFCATSYSAGEFILPKEETLEISKIKRKKEGEKRVRSPVVVWFWSCNFMAVEYRCCEAGFFIRIAIVTFLVLFAGMMSGLTLGLMSLSLVDLEVLAKSGTPKDQKHAGILFFNFFFFGWHIVDFHLN